MARARHLIGRGERRAAGRFLPVWTMAVLVACLASCNGGDGTLDTTVAIPFDPEAASVVGVDVVIRQPTGWPGVDRHVWCARLRSGDATSERCRITYDGGDAALAQLDPGTRALREAVETCLDAILPGTTLPLCWTQELDQRQAYADAHVVDNEIPAILRETPWIGVVRGVKCTFLRLGSGDETERCAVYHQGDPDALAALALRDISRAVVNCYSIQVRLSSERGLPAPDCVFQPMAGAFLSAD